MKKYTIGMLLFPDLTLLDFAGPYDVFIRASCFDICTISESTKPMKAEGGLTLQAQYTFDDCPEIDLLFVPGGRGVTAVLTNTSYLTFLKKVGEKAEYVTAVCTGSLLLAAAGLLSGYKATTHWRSIPLLKLFGVETVRQRVVKDRNRMTGGGITAGIDFGLTLTALIAGETEAKAIQLQLEYSPEPPFNSGIFDDAESEVQEIVLKQTEPLFKLRKDIIERIVTYT